MVKKFFRPFICAACAAMSVICGTVPMFNVYADNETVMADTEAEVHSETQSSETQASETQTMETQGSETQTPETQASGTQTPETQAPGTQTPETQAPGTQTPETQAPETQTPETQAPETQAPETQTPETQAPETQAPETECDIRNSVILQMKQENDEVAPTDDFVQEVSVSYLDVVDSKITYTLDPSLNVKRIDVGSNTYLEGGQAVISCSDGEKEVPITASIDLSGYTNVTKIVFIPKISSYPGMEANFSVVLKLNEESAGKGVSEVSCKTLVNVTKDQNTADFESGLSTKFKTASIGKPALSLTYEGKEYKENGSDAIEFDKEFALNFDSINMTAYGQTSSLFYSITTPTFVTLKEITIPDFIGTSNIKVTATVDGKEVFLGESKPGSKIEVGKNKVSEVKLEIIPDGSEIATKTAGKLVFANDNKKNKKTNNAAFASNLSAEIGGTDSSVSSNIISVNVKSRQIDTPETQPPQTNNNFSGNTSGNISGNAGVDIGDNPGNQEQTEPETENPNDVARKKGETERKEKIKKEAIQNEKRMKSKQSSILAERLSKIQAQSSVPGSTSVFTAKKKESQKADEKYADWKVKPINESIIKDLVPKEIMPISENLAVHSHVSNRQIYETN